MENISNPIRRDAIVAGMFFTFSIAGVIAPGEATYCATRWDGDDLHAERLTSRDFGTGPAFFALSDERAGVSFHLINEGKEDLR